MFLLCTAPSPNQNDPLEDLPNTDGSKMNKTCARCQKVVYPIEELKCLDKVREVLLYKPINRVGNYYRISPTYFDAHVCFVCIGIRSFLIFWYFAPLFYAAASHLLSVRVRARRLSVHIGRYSH